MSTHQTLRPLNFLVSGAVSVNGVMEDVVSDQLDGKIKKIKPASTSNGTEEVAKKDMKKGAMLKHILKLIEENNLVSGCMEGSEKVIDFKHPAELEDIIDLDLRNDPATEEELIEACRLTVDYSVKTTHPHFYNQLYGGVDEFGLAGTWLSESLNTNQYTFEVAPVFIVTEKTILSRLLQLVGFHDGDGIFCPGGSVSNMYAVASARYKFFPDVKMKGIFGMKPLIMFTSEESHYSMSKAAHWLGIGYNNVIKVKTDKRGRMIPSELDRLVTEAKENGNVPFFVNATTGTTVLGAFDPLDEIADVCEKHGLWLHVDGCWGASVLVSRTHRHLMKGVERINSLSWNPHKMMGAPLQTSAFLIKEKGLLHKCNSASATYLFQQDKFYDVSYDTGDKSVQCGRKVDGFKLWLMWKAAGELELERRVDHIFNLASKVTEMLKSREGFRLVLDQFECTNICFWYIPPRLRNRPETDEWWDQVAGVAPKVKENMIKEGSMMIGYQPLSNKNLRNFFRLVFTCVPPPRYEDLDYIIQTIERLGSDL